MIIFNSGFYIYLLIYDKMTLGEFRKLTASLPDDFTISLLRKEYAHLNNKKNDISNKIVHDILKDASIVVMQDEQIKHWVNEKTSSKIHHSILGRLKSRLVRHDKVVVLSKWLPTTKYCYKCGTLNETLTLNDRIFICPCCSNTEDIDIHAANNMIYFYFNSDKFKVNNA